MTHRIANPYIPGVTTCLDMAKGLVWHEYADGSAKVSPLSLAKWLRICERFGITLVASIEVDGL